LQCAACATEVGGAFSANPDRLINVPEPHGSLLELFLRVRGNVKDMERELGLSYPTVRARLDEAFTAAGFGRNGEAQAAADAVSARRAETLDALERREISAQEAARRLRELPQAAERPIRVQRPERTERGGRAERDGPKEQIERNVR
jgi:hypothetical protein